MLERLYSSFAEFSRLYGTGDPASDAVGATLILSFIALMIGLISYRRERAVKNAGPSIERMQSMNGRLEKIERTVNEFRTEMLRNAELSRGSLEFAKEELVQIRDLLLELVGRQGSGGSGSGGSRTPSGSMGSGGNEYSGAQKTAPTDVGTTEISPQEVQTLFDEVIDEEKSEDSPRETVPVVESGTIFTRLRRSRESIVGRIKGFFSGKAGLDASMIEQMEEMLISSDIGVKTSLAIIENLKGDIARGERIDQEALVEKVKRHLVKVLVSSEDDLREIAPVPREDGPFVIVLVGVNGAGKTTTVAKMAHQWHLEGKSVMVAAADTFRAAAVEQLREWADRIHVPIISGAMGAKPATVVYDAMVAAKREKVDVLIIDTAGRLQNKSSLMQELEGIKNAMTKHQPSAPHEVLLVVDGSSGQNAIVQAKEFNAAVKVTGVVITKLDGTPKGGTVVAIKSEFGIPVRYIGVGEKQDDLRKFDAQEFVDALIGDASGAEKAYALDSALSQEQSTGLLN